MSTSLAAFLSLCAAHPSRTLHHHHHHHQLPATSTSTTSRAVPCRMSGSYRLEAPRPRHPQNRPHPIAILHSSDSNSPSFTRDRDNDNDRPSQTLLYDLPSISPPTSPSSPRRGSLIVSPTSPTTRSQSIAPSQRRTPPLPGSAGHAKRNRSVTPLGVSQSELEAFAEYCRAWCANQLFLPFTTTTGLYIMKVMHLHRVHFQTTHSLPSLIFLYPAHTD